MAARAEHMSDNDKTEEAVQSEIFERAEEVMRRARELLAQSELVRRTVGS